MLYILYGEDDFSLQQYLDELKKSVGDVTVLALNTTVLEGAQVTVKMCSTRILNAYRFPLSSSAQFQSHG